MNLIIVDGYNLIHGIPGLRRYLDVSLERARDELTALIKSYQLKKKVLVTLVFDGQPLQPGASGPHRRLKILFSKSPATADDLIKHMLRRQAHPKGVTVVTDDAELVRFARSYQTQVMATEEFYTMITKRRRRTKKNGIYDKFDSEMSEEELAEWMQLFGTTRKKS